jgi:hypothetical protein
MALTDKLKELSQAIEVKREETKTAWAAFDEKRKALNGSDIDLSNPDDEKTKKALDEADEAMKPYSTAKDALRVLEGQFERLAIMAADDGEKTVDIRKENEHDRTPRRRARPSAQGRRVRAVQGARQVGRPGGRLRGQVRRRAAHRADGPRRVQVAAHRPDRLGRRRAERAGALPRRRRPAAAAARHPRPGDGRPDRLERGRVRAAPRAHDRRGRGRGGVELGDIDGGDVTAAEGGLKPESGPHVRGGRSRRSRRSRTGSRRPATSSPTRRSCRRSSTAS